MSHRTQIPPAVVPREGEELVGDLLPIAARLVGAVHDHGPEGVAAVLAHVPLGRHDALAVVLAAMVDPDRTISESLAWLEELPRSLEGTEYDVDPHESGQVSKRPCPDCGRMVIGKHLARHQRRNHVDAVTIDRLKSGRQQRLSRDEVAEAVHELTAAGLSGYRIAELLGVTSRTVFRIRSRGKAADGQQDEVA